jgi:transposase-like protein
VVQIGDRKKPVRKRRDPIPGKIGRPTSMTDEVKASLLAALRSGATHEVAATYAGVGETTFYRWMERGRREQGRQDLALSAGEHFEPRPDEDIFREFREEVDAASASAAIVATTTIRTAMTDMTSPWATRVRAASWYLERRIPGFQPKEMVGLEVQGGAHPLQVEYSETEERDKDRQIVEVLLATGAIAALTGGEDEDEDEEREDGR